MFGLIIALHVIICTLLIGIILIQAGRGGGLVESLSGMESMFGTKTNRFLTRTTTILSIIFFITCIGLAFLSLRQNRSLMKNVLPKTASPQNITPETSQIEPQPQASGQKEAGEVPKTE